MATLDFGECVKGGTASLLPEEPLRRCSRLCLRTKPQFDLKLTLTGARRYPNKANKMQASISSRALSSSTAGPRQVCCASRARTALFYKQHPDD